ncbi:peroxisomal membrane protein PEX14 isoform X2 [Diospyros lotus]|uniref:peroxisomal membrane protein PEX14 isoform X2 n=1 Tax=Diospyros lotus TaxID=55363 RepID=UPI002256A1A6|nr:peroxisomal membrane protein PEX14 isoform X2 [Diospyros lotus]
MASQSASPPNPTDDKPQNSEIVQPAVEDKQNTKAETSGGISSPSVFVNSEPMREEQVQNAVKFLSHPKVKGSPVIYRRSFLERKGLTKEEIDEAFRRVPDPPQTISSAQPAGANQDGQIKSLPNAQPQVSTQALQPSGAVPAGVVSKTVSYYQFRWSHALFAVGGLALSGAGTAVLFKNVIVPRLKSWVRKVVFEEDEETCKKINSKANLEQEAAAAAKAAAAAAADVARVSQEMLVSKSEERKYFEELMNLIGVQVQEMKSLSNAVMKLEGQSKTSEKIPPAEQDHHFSFTNLRQSNANGKVDFYSATSASPPATAEQSVAPHPKSYMDIMAMVQRGEKPPNVREINDQPPNPNQPLPNPHSAPRAKPWEFGQNQNSFRQVSQIHESSDGSNSSSIDYGVAYQLNEDSSVPWWQRKNVRIAEIENENDPKSGSLDVVTNERPVQRSWVPPQPPPVALPEAAAAIRQPKKPQSQKQPGDDRVAANPSDVADELQRITKISESGGVVDANGENSGPNGQLPELGVVVDANGGSSGLNTSEIQEERVESY